MCNIKICSGKQQNKDKNTCMPVGRHIYCFNHFIEKSANVVGRSQEEGVR